MLRNGENFLYAKPPGSSYCTSFKNAPYTSHSDSLSLHCGYDDSFHSLRASIRIARNQLMLFAVFVLLPKVSAVRSPTLIKIPTPGYIGHHRNPMAGSRVFFDFQIDYHSIARVSQLRFKRFGTCLYRNNVPRLGITVCTDRIQCIFRYAPLSLHKTMFLVLCHIHTNEIFTHGIT